MPIINGGGNLTGTDQAIAVGEKMNLPVDFNLEAGEIGNILNNYYGDKFLIKNDDNIRDVHLLPLTETKILIAYTEPRESTYTNDTKICVQLLTVSGSNIIDKSETLKFTITGADDGITTACVLSEKKVLLVCNAYSDPNKGEFYNICMVYINDNTISIGARKPFSVGYNCILKPLSETKCILFNSNDIYILYVDNDNVSFSPSGALHAGGGDLSLPCLINKNIFVFCFSSSAYHDSYNLYLKVGIIADDDTITLGPPQLVEKGTSLMLPSIQGIYNINETNKILVAYKIDDHTQKDKSSTNCIKIGNITGTTITCGNKYTFKQFKRVESSKYTNLDQEEKTVILSENLALYYEYYYTGSLNLDPNIYLTLLNINDLEIVSSNETVIATDASNGVEKTTTSDLRDDRILYVCSMTDTKSLIVYRTNDNKYYCKLISSLGMFFNYANCLGVYYMPTNYSFKDLPHKPDLLPPKSIKSKISVIKNTK